MEQEACDSVELVVEDRYDGAGGGGVRQGSGHELVVGFPEFTPLSSSTCLMWSPSGGIIGNGQILGPGFLQVPSSLAVFMCICLSVFISVFRSRQYHLPTKLFGSFLTSYNRLFQSTEIFCSLQQSARSAPNFRLALARILLATSAPSASSRHLQTKLLKALPK